MWVYKGEMSMTVEEWLGKDNKLGIDIWNRKYRDGDETFDEWLDRVSGGDPGVRKLIIEKKMLFGGRTLTNRGTNSSGSMSNCYSEGFCEDSVDDIMQTATNIALTFKSQGGEGISLSKLRPKGCGVNNGKYESDGIIPFMELFNQTTESISQGGSRKGALIMTLDAWHKESEDFIKIKSEQGRIQKANLSLEIDDEFMECVKKYYDTGEIITKHISRDYEGNRIEYDITPIKLYKLMMEKAWDWAEPGCIFTNRFRNYNLMEFCDDYNIESCNPCFSGEMKLLTVDGFRTFEELDGKTVEIYNSEGNITESKIWCSGEKDTVKVKLADGNEIICTPNHKFLTTTGEEYSAKNLAKKHIVPCNKVNLNHDLKYVKLGFIQGDGELSHIITNYVVVNIGEKDTDIRTLFNDERYEVPTNTDKADRVIYLYGYNELITELGFSEKPLPERLFPSTYDEWDYSKKASFLCGCFSANGSVLTTHRRIMYKTTSIEFAKKLVETLKEDFNIDAYITTNKEKDIEFPNGIYTCKESYDVNIGKIQSMILFVSQIGFVQYYKKLALSKALSESGTMVYSVKPYKKVKVYDFSEPQIHWGIVNGYIVHNCGEQPLSPQSACNLCSINLSEFVKDPFDKCARFDFDDFADTIDITVRAMDQIIDENKDRHALPEQREKVINYRNLGIGIMGMYDMLCKLNMTYGSKESIDFMDSVMGFMFRRAVIASSHLAKEKGTFPKYSSNLLKSTIIKKHFTEEELNILGISRYGLRNCSLLSIAPAGSIGTMLNISTGCEPAFQISYKRRTESLNGEETYYDVYIDIAKQYMKKYNTEKLPHTFVSAGEISWRDRIDMQAILQEHVDTAISSTINLPNNITLEQVEQLYLYAWEKGLKGVTIFRDGCKRAGILTTSDTESNVEKTEDNSEPKTCYMEGTLNLPKQLERGMIIKADSNCVGKLRILQTGCGTLHCCAYFDPITGELISTYLSKGSHGGCVSLLTGLSRMISISARGGIDIYTIADQLFSVGSCPSYTSRRAKYGDTSKGSSCPTAVGYALLEMYEEMQREINDDVEEIEMKPIKIEAKEPKKGAKVEVAKPKCPECGAELFYEGGCNFCRNCGYSKCD